MASKKIRRHDLIQQVVQERGGVSVGALAEMLGVSTQTIRRDLDNICDGNGLRRVHGRIELSMDRLNTPFDQRAGTNIVGKRAIGEAAAAEIPNGSTVFISLGSTPLSVARALVRRRELTIITNNLSAAMALSEEVSNRIILPGGELRLPDRDFIGEEVVEFFGRFRAEYAVFGVAGVADDGGLLEFHPAEVRVRQQMFRNAQTSLLVLDHTKFGRLAPALGGNLADVDRIVTDRAPGAEYTDLIAPLSDRIIFAEDAE
ncbi:DeoR/GlpR family DNA-binding transcription regulator [Nitratireductor aquimarinus]|uniref:DeoR/GlpR family DNA-binding transcription regulator n=1 Tax=Nitratireductor aquimarinus TaxID=889300 RepID=A0ABU4AME4_9HYPH|nr:DeoR/GlpR family DNA-binding transcription regulator [Nitratireductor aquimarinus]MDV6227400.1 DeoR/GlpR family DNA-binding transcription regulator [Nitratireductor aquimarinus]